MIYVAPVAQQTQINECVCRALNARQMPVHLDKCTQEELQVHLMHRGCTQMHLTHNQCTKMNRHVLKYTTNTLK